MAASQTLRTLKLSLLADVSGFGSNLDKAGNKFKDFSQSVERASGFASVAIGAIGGLALSAINAASDLSETSSAVEQIFGRRAAARIEDYARTTATGLGLSRQAALEAAQQFGIFGNAADLSGEDLTDFTIDLTTLAADLASFNNTTVDQAINALGSALRGESEPIRNYGVLLDAAKVENRALADGLIETGEEVDDQARIIATFNEILAQTEIQQGDATRTSESFANQQKNLTAELENFRVEIGEELFPILEEVLPKIRDLFDRITETDPEQIVAIGEGFLKFAAGVVALNAALKGFAAVQGAYKALTSPIGAVAAVFGGAAAATVYTGQNLPPGFIGAGAAVPSLPGLSASVQQQVNRERFGASAGQRQTGNVIVSGVVGSTYQVTREIERFQALRDRSRGTLPTPGVPQ